MPSRRREIAARKRNKQNKQDSSVPNVGALEFLRVGVLRKPHGVHGEMLMAVLTDFPERIQPKVHLYLGEDHTPYEVKKIRHHNQGMIISFVEVEGRNAVDNWRNVPVFVRVADRPPLPEGEYYLHEVLGLAVITDDGQSLGKLVDYIETGANHVYIVRNEEKQEVLLPAIDDVILSVDLDAGQMTVHLLEGLLPD